MAVPEVAANRWFAFHSSLWVNLHHFLYVTARARSGLDGSRTAVTSALSDTVRFGALCLAELDMDGSVRQSGLDPSLVAALDAAAPVSRSLWWPRHDAGNREWIAGVIRLLAQHGDAVAAQESRDDVS